MVEAARREFAATLSARPLEDQSVRLETAEELAKLRRERDELRAEIAALRGAAPVPARASLLTIPESVNPRAVAPPVTKIVDSPITPAPAAARTPTATQRMIPAQGAPIQPVRPAPQSTSMQVTATPSRPATKASGKTHTVVAGDTFFSLSKKFGVKMEDLAAANGMTIKSPLKLGMVLKIP
jgi:LysM repeat protein